MNARELNPDEELNPHATAAAHRHHGLFRAALGDGSKKAD